MHGLTNLYRTSWVPTTRAHLILQDAHRKYGEVVRIGSNVASFSNPEAIPTVYPVRPGVPKVVLVLLLHIQYSGDGQFNQIGRFLCDFYVPTPEVMVHYTPSSTLLMSTSSSRLRTPLHSFLASRLLQPSSPLWRRYHSAFVTGSTSGSPSRSRSLTWDNGCISSHLTLWAQRDSPSDMGFWMKGKTWAEC